MKIGLFFGTFNPIHVGHLVIANYIVEYSDLDQVWFIVTPQSPFKTKISMLDNRQRYEMVYRATKDYQNLRPCDIEFHLSQPNYTVDTLTYLHEKYPEHTFALIMGEDNLHGFHKWKNYEVILNNHDIYVYPRHGEQAINAQFQNHERIKKVDAPIMELSSTFIRKSRKEGKNVKAMLPDAVWEYLDEMNFYS